MRRLSLLAVAFATLAFAQPKEPKFLDALDTKIPHVSTDPDLRIDYDIVYVRAGRAGDTVHKRFYTDFSSPVTMEPGADLMLLHPDGTEELLAEGGDGSVTDPVVSLDGKSVYFTRIHHLVKANQWSPPRQGADIYKLHLATRKLVKLTNQRYSPNTGAAVWSSDYRKSEPGKSHLEAGVFNMGACPLPGGRIAFTSNRDGFRPAKGYPAIALQLFVMDDRDTDIGDDETPQNLDKIGHLNLAGALHPVALADGRIMYSTLESQGNRGDILWGIWTIHPDGTNWNPLISAFDPGGAPNGFHFQTQLSDRNIVIEEYYNQNNSGFGTLIKMPPSPPEGYAPFGPASMKDKRNEPWRFGRHDNGNPRWYRMPFMPTGAASITPFAFSHDGPADRSVRGDKNSPAVGKFTHPSSAPDNHLLTVYSPGPANHQYTFLPQIDGGIYVLKKGAAIDEPAGLRLIKNDPKYNECWPRAVVPYERIFGVKEPRSIPRLANDGKLSKHLPEGTPFALVGVSSFYKRESYPNGAVPKGGVTATFDGGNDAWKGLDAFTSHGNGMPLNWHNQGADAGLYTNADIHAVRVLAMEPTTDRRGAHSGRRYHNHAGERLRILGEIPLRKFAGGDQPLDPDGNPDTSFLAKIPADVGFTFQTLDRDGMVLNMAQTWHQLRPGEVRHNCGGCHAHSQKPTDFGATLASKPDYAAWDLTKSSPVLVAKSADESKKKWDSDDASGLRFASSPVNVEYHRDVKPILMRSCVACHTGDKPAGMLNLDADAEVVSGEKGKFPGTYYRLAMDEGAKYSPKPIGWDSYGYPNASRYVRKFQSRRSLLTWKVYGRRLDGFTNDDHPSEAPGDRTKLVQAGKELELSKHKARYDLDFTGSVMPPPDAVKAGKVKPLSDDDKRTLVRWIDLGCPIDLDDAGYGWTLDDQRPTLAFTVNEKSVSVGAYDYAGLDAKSLRVTADGADVTAKFTPAGDGVWRWTPPAGVRGKWVASVADRQGNVTKIERVLASTE